jgi:hypothetical protein
VFEVKGKVDEVLRRSPHGTGIWVEKATPAKAPTKAKTAPSKGKIH